MRYDCDDPEFEGAYIEFSETWSRADVRAAWKANDVELLDILQRKVTALHLPCVDAEPITDPDELTEGRVDGMDARLYTWFVTSWVKAMDDLANLGNALGRRLFDTSEPTGKKANPTAKTKSKPVAQASQKN